MQITLKFDVGDETKQGKVFFVDWEKDDKGPRTRYWLFNGGRFYSEDELEEVGTVCESCGRKGVTV